MQWRKIAQDIKDAIKGEELRQALSCGFLEMDTTVKHLLVLHIIQGIAIILLGIAALRK